MIFLTWIVLISVTWFEMSTEFIFSSDCVAPQPCTCISRTLNCDYKQLSQVPTFTRNNERASFLAVYLSNNQLTVIPAYAFKNLSSVNVSSLEIRLYNNHIYNIEMHAFSGIETVVTNLDLSNNNLTHLPQALEELSSLNNLNLLRNPLLNLDATVMGNIGGRLKTFSVSLDRFTGFPDELKHLSGLSALTLDDINFNVSIANFTVFHSFENSLTSLEMSYTRFESIPAAFCRLNILQSFTLNSSPYLGKYYSSIFDDCSHPMTTVTNLTLENDRLTVFPKLSSIFPNLHYLNLRGNSLYFIENSSLEGLTFLSTLEISFNRFTSIPSAVNKAANLQNLYMQENQIGTVDSFDLLHLNKLTSIRLDYNPLVYISPHAFTHSTLLSTVRMHGTMLGHIPQSLLGLRHLRDVYLSGKPIECSCHAMSYLKFWNVTSINIYATCSSRISVKSYLMTDLPKCP